MLAPVTHILPLTTIRRERVLPVPGKVLVRKGQKVSPGDSLAEADLSPEHLLLDIRRGLGKPAAQADALLKVKPGSVVAEGDVLAGPVGIARRVVRAPRAGRVLQAENGRLLLEVAGQPFVLRAGLAGEVVELLPDRGAIVQSTGALVQGVWGNGQVDAGLLAVLAKTPGQELHARDLDVSQRGAVVLAGACRDREALKSAQELSLRGLIFASLDPGLLPEARRLRLPVIVVEGLGRKAMNAAAYKLLASYEQREVALNAEPWDAFAGTRPEITIQLPGGGTPPLPHEAEEFAAGQTVRIVVEPYFGQIGTLIDLSGPANFPGGARAQAGQVHLEDGNFVAVPLANLEVLA